MEIRLNINIDDGLLEDITNDFVTGGYDSFSDCVTDVLDGYSLEKENTHILNIDELKIECKKLVNKWFDEDA